MNPYAPPPQNPYAAPHNPYGAPPPQYSYAPTYAAPYLQSERYVPLGWRTWLATVSLLGVVLMDLAQDAASFAFPEVAGGGEPEMVPALIVLVTSLGLLAAHVIAAVFFSIWIHRAAKNLLALGRQGMQFTPGWCVGWFFVPFANLVKPLQAMQEIWRASGPEARDGYWNAQPSTPLLGLWWATWLLGGVIANISIRLDGSAATALGAVSSIFTAIAAAAGIFLIHRIASRQAASSQAG